MIEMAESVLQYLVTVYLCQVGLSSLKNRNLCSLSFLMNEIQEYIAFTYFRYIT